MERWVSLDCTTKRVTLRTEKNSEIVTIGERQDYLFNVISILIVEKLVRKGCVAYLAFISNPAPVKLTVGDIQTIRDFLDVFLDELSSVHQLKRLSLVLTSYRAPLQCPSLPITWYRRSLLN